MYAGRVVEHGPAGKVFTDALHPYSAALSAAFPHIGDAGGEVRAGRPARRPARPAPTCRPAAPSTRAARDAFHECDRIDPELRVRRSANASAAVAILVEPR